MIDHKGSGAAEPPSASEKPNWISRRISKIKRYFHNCRAEKKKENATDRAARSTARATWAIAILTVVTIGVGVSQYVIFGRQLTLAYPPNLKASHFHIWEKGHGMPFGPANVIPRLISRTPISGALLIVNDGSEEAFIRGGGCLAHWQKEARLPMNSPFVTNPTDIKPLKYMHDIDIYKFKGGTVNKVIPGQFIGCEFETNVPDRNDIDGKSLYVLVYIYSYDRLNTF